jgi:uncharacterized membrane protein
LFLLSVLTFLLVKRLTSLLQEISSDDDSPLSILSSPSYQQGQFDSFASPQRSPHITARENELFEEWDDYELR